MLIKNFCTKELLYLPLKNKDTSISGSANFSIPIDTPFYDIWHQGPKNPGSPKELTNAIKILGLTLSKFITQCSGQFKVYSKDHPRDLVTEIDIGIELLLRNWLKRFYPEHKIIGEEEGRDEISAEDTVWYIDPVDGTKNFVHGKKDVAINICALKTGTPLVSFVGLPLYDNYYFGGTETPVQIISNKQQALFQQQLSEPKNILGTEFFCFNQFQDDRFQTILSQLNCTGQKLKSISVNIIKILENKIPCFYKKDIKTWDFMAPAALIYLLAKEKYYFSLFVPKDQKTQKYNNSYEIDIFSNSPYLIDQYNRKHALDARVGLLIIYPKSQGKFKDIILKHYLNESISPDPGYISKSS